MDVPVEDAISIFLDNGGQTELSELADKFEEANRQGRKRAYVNTYGLVSDLSLTADSRGYRYMMLYDIDAEEEVRVRVPKHVPINFSVNSTV